MNFYAKLMRFFLIFLFSMIMFGLSLPIYFAVAKKQNYNIIDMEPNQSFSSAAGERIQYNFYIQNKGKSVVICTLTTVSSRHYYVEVWRDTDANGNGDVQLTPPQGTVMTISAGEVATLIVSVSIPFDAMEGSIDRTTIEAVDTESEASDSITVITTVDSNLPYPSNWRQLGSDPAFPTPPPEKIDLKAFYYSNNGTDVFFRMAEAGNPDTRPFLYFVCLDTKAGGQQIEGYFYDYLLSSDGVLYLWNGEDWINSDSSVYWQIDGSSIVLSTDLENLNMDALEIHILALTTTKDWTIKDNMGPYYILKNDISEIPVLLIPILVISIYFAMLRTKKHVNRH